MSNTIQTITILTTTDLTYCTKSEGNDVLCRIVLCLFIMKIPKKSNNEVILDFAVFVVRMSVNFQSKGKRDTIVSCTRIKNTAFNI